jgi:hypothetical protein
MPTPQSVFFFGRPTFASAQLPVRDPYETAIEQLHSITLSARQVASAQGPKKFRQQFVRAPGSMDAKDYPCLERAF